jgi:hypothetical protein
MEVHGFTSGGHILYTDDDGFNWEIPDDPSNRHRQAIEAWEAEGNVIPAYEAPPPSLPNLFPDQFWFGLRVAGYEDDVRAWVDSMNDPEDPSYDPVAWASASAKLEYATYFERNHPLVEAARQYLGMTEAELDDLWAYAASSGAL